MNYTLAIPKDTIWFATLIENRITLNHNMAMLRRMMEMHEDLCTSDNI